MYHKVDKRKKADLTLKQVKAAGPVPEFYAENSTLYLYPCVCRHYAARSVMDTAVGHRYECSLHHIGDSMGCDLTGVTAAWVGDTESGEYRGIFVTYSTFVRDDSTMYHPVILVKETFIDIDFSSCVGLDISQNDTIDTFSDSRVRWINQVYQKSAGYTKSYAKSDVIRRVKKVNGVLYVSLCTVLNRWYAASLRRI